MSKKLYRIDVRVYATIYIKASSAAAARDIAKQSKKDYLELDPGIYGSVEVSSARFDDPELPDVSYSGSLTVHGPDDDSKVERVQP